MERIGYIYRYNTEEEKGILVFGCNHDSNNITYKPIKFCKADCISDVSTGQLVYFTLENSFSASHIDKASLCNFKRAVVSEIVSCYDTKEGLNHDFLQTLIRFEDLNDVECDFWDDFQDYLDEQDGSSPQRNQPKKLPDSIDELFAFFGTMLHPKFLGDLDGLVSIDILKIELWIDKDIAESKSLFGKTADEVLDLFELFVKKKRNADERFNSLRINDDSISPSWKLLLSSLTSEDLRIISKKEPLLQPALPIEFCLNNLDVLSIDYGFPNVAVCEAYYRFRISSIKLSSEYRYMSEMIYVATYCTANHKINEGVQACMMGKAVLKTLKELLDNQLKTVVLDQVKKNLTSMSGNKIDGEQRVLSLLEDENLDYLIKIGCYFDSYSGVIYNPSSFYRTIQYDCDYYATIRFTLEEFEDLAEEERIGLNLSIRSKFRECLIGIAKEHYYDGKVYRLCHLIEDYPQYLTSEDFDVVKGIVNAEFSNLEKLDELDTAANCGLITEKQHLERYKEITKEFDLEGLLSIVECGFKKIPTLAQAYLIKAIIAKFGFKTLDTYSYNRTNSGIRNLEELLKWFNHQCEYGPLDSSIWGDILKETTDMLGKDDRWQLFEKGLIESPCLDNIRERLDVAYNQNDFQDECFQKDCFQDVMCVDILEADDNKHKFMISEHLDQKHLNELMGKCEGAMKLYLWAINPDDSFDWNLITSFFAELPEEQQIRLFRNIFFQIASKSVVITIDELYKTLVESEKKACQAVRGLMYLLKELLTPDGVLKNEVLDEIIGDGIGNIRKFLKAKTFFYPCNGHIALTQNKQDRDYHTYNGCINKVVIRGIAYYSISFYDIPHDVCDGEVDWLDNTDILKAKAVLETNLKAKLINGDYIISISEEVAVKQFVMAFHIDDHCCLLDTKQLMIEKGYLPPNNSYQPLYTNYIRPYDDDSFDVCRCTDYIDVDPINGIPFYWCDKKPCVRRCHYILPLSEWEEFKVSDFIYILLGSKRGNLHKVWKMTIKMSLFINAYVESKRHKVESDEHNGKGQSNTEKISIKKSEEIGVLTDELSVVQDICDFDDGYEEYEEYDDSGYDEYSQDDDTYGRYAGSYAQDEMGYSDDDIDTIFDGDPSAYWNID